MMQNKNQKIWPKAIGRRSGMLQLLKIVSSAFTLFYLFFFQVVWLLRLTKSYNFSLTREGKVWRWWSDGRICWLNGKTFLRAGIKTWREKAQCRICEKLEDRTCQKRSFQELLQICKANSDDPIFSNATIPLSMAVQQTREINHRLVGCNKTGMRALFVDLLAAQESTFVKSNAIMAQFLEMKKKHTGDNQLIGQTNWLQPALELAILKYIP